MSQDERPRPGLRERKKAKTRTEIQRQALRLFREQGYEGTTVDQIAEAAEVSQSTFFRYFPTKEEVVLWDEFDPLLIQAVKAQPPDSTPIQALRASFRVVYSELSAEQWREQRDRMDLILAVPELRAAILDQLTGTIQLVAQLVAERLGRRPEDFAVRTFAGAVIGVSMATMLAAAEDPSADLMALIDAGFGHLEAGLQL